MRAFAEAISAKEASVKITDIQASVVGRNVPDSGGSTWTFVRVYTDAGLYGTGECNSAGPIWSRMATKEIVMGRYRSLLLGQDPLDIGPLWERLRRDGRYSGGSTAPMTFALTGIENALWDIAGKHYGAPVYRLLGGAFRQRIRLYADCHAGHDNSPAAYAEKAREVLAEGYTAVKFDVDGMAPGKHDRYNYTLSARELDHVVKVIAGVRDAIGPENDLAIDCHGQFDLPSAISLAHAVEDLRLMWLEEPLPAENVDALAELRAKTSTVICTGENQYTRYGFRELLERRAADIIMPDLAKAGGILEGKRIAELAEIHYVPVAPHNVSSPLGMMAACHVCAAIPNFLILEFHGRGIAWWGDLCQGDKPFIREGYMAVADAPGLGIELDRDAARELLMTGDTLFE
jgi:galactonate dehydratase